MEREDEMGITDKLKKRGRNLARGEGQGISREKQRMSEGERRRRTGM